MIITIFGATGMVGKELVKQALFKNHLVKAFGRNVFTAGFTENKNLQLVQGALFDDRQVLDAIKGSDAVLSALGGDIGGTDKTRSLGMKHIVAQMKKAAVNRIVAIGGKGCLTGNDDKLIMDAPGFPPEYLPVSYEHLKAYEYLEESGLSWTFVCPPDIMNEGPTGIFKTAAGQMPAGGNDTINAGDLALFMLKELEKNDFVQSRVGISN